MGLCKKSIHFLTVVKMFNNGFTNVEISEKIGMSQKTISKWLKEIKAEQKETNEILKNIENQLKTESAKLNNSAAIKNLTIAINNIEKRWFYQK